MLSFREVFRTLFLAKEIVSKTGELHFQRWRVLWTPFFAIYIHYIAKSDEDLYPHSHPFSFCSVILRGGYKEEWTDGHNTEWTVNKPYRILFRSSKGFHKITLLKPTWTLVLTGRRESDWGYLVNREFVQHEVYRQNKNKGMYTSE